MATGNLRQPARGGHAVTWSSSATWIPRLGASHTRVLMSTSLSLDLGHSLAAQVRLLREGTQAPGVVADEQAHASPRPCPKRC